MKVKVARSAGFCVGVKRAVELVLRIADEHRNRNIFTHGPLIHNPQTVNMLAEKGIKVLDEKSEPSAGDIVVIRSHGIAPSIRENLKKSGFDIFDATCPKVAYVHRITAKLSAQGYAVIIVGDHNHSEVIGIKGEVKGEVAVVDSRKQVESLPDWKKVAVVAQTTMDRKAFESVTDAIERKFPDIIIKNTLCSETSYRQDEIEELARDTDTFVVIGGKNSANTGRLFKLALGSGIPTFWIETAEELSSEDFRDVARVSVVAGASTPHWIIDRVVERLETINRKYLPPWRWRWLKKIAYTFIRGNLLASIAAGLLTYSISIRNSLPNSGFRAIAVSLALMGVFNLYENREWQGLALMDPSKVEFVRRRRKVLMPLAFISLLLSIGSSCFVGMAPAIIASLVALLITTYWKIPLFERFLPIWIKDGLMLAVWILLVWVFGAGFSIGILIPLAMFGVLRAIIMGLKELETDRILQRKSITATLGEKISILLGTIPAIAGIGMLIFFLDWMQYVGLLIGMFALWILMVCIASRIIRKGTYIETITDLLIIAVCLF